MSRRTSLTLLGWAVLTAGLLSAFGNVFEPMWVRWFPAWNEQGSLYDRLVGGESYYTHGPLVPLISLVIALLLLRHTSVPLKPAPALGGALLALFLLLHLAGSAARIHFVSGFAMIGALAASVVIAWGLPAARRLAFPLALLAFMVPLPEVTIADLNFRLKMAAAQLGVAIANFLGVVAERVGNRVLMEGDKSLVIANVCNGLRTLISLLAFGALYCFVCRLRGWWRAGLFAMTIPVAVAANSLRVVSLIVVADIWSPQVATGAYHDISGILIFVLAFLLMFALERLVLGLRRLAGRPVEVAALFAQSRRTDDDSGQAGRLALAGWTPRVLAAGIALGAAAMAVWGMSRPAPAAGALAHASMVPGVLELDGRRWVGYDMPLDRRTQVILETGDYLNRAYVTSGEPEVELCVVFSQDNRKGTHPPDLCLEGGGSDIIAKNDVVAAGLPCRELLVQNGRSSQYFLYTYKCGPDYTRSFWRQQWVILRNGLLSRPADGALVRVSTPVREGDPQSLARARRIAAEVMQTAAESISQSH
jgi:EpsI family protein